MWSRLKFSSISASKLCKESQTLIKASLTSKGEPTNSTDQRSGPLYVFMFTDLDSPQTCVPELIQSWVKAPLNPGFFLRVAVMEIESWIMADRRALATFLSIPVNRIPNTPDDILQPKEFLVSLARKIERKA